MNTLTYCIKQRKFPLKASEISSLIGYGFGVFGVLNTLSSIPSWVLYLAPIFSVLIGMIIWSEIKLWNDWEHRFTIDANYDGDDSYNEIRKAKKSISVTHFSRDVPSENYRLLMKEKLRQKVRIVRYVPKSLDLNDVDFIWLKEFEGLKHYTMIRLDVEDFPMDVLVIDDFDVKIRFPVNSRHTEFLETLVFKNRNVATLYNKMLNRIKEVDQ